MKEPMKKKIRAVVWYVLVGSGDPKDDYIEKIKAISQEDARYLAIKMLMSSNKYIKSVDRARKLKKKKPK